MKKAIFGFFTVFVLVFSLSVTTATAKSNQPYLGFSLGPTDIDLCGGFSACNDSDTGFKIYGGVEVDKTFAFEASYFNLGSASYNGWWGKYKFDVTGLSVDGIVKLPINKKAHLFGKVGLTLWGLNSFLFASGGGLDLKAGVGASFDIQKNLALRFEYEIYDLGGTDASMASAGLVLGF